MFMFNFTDEFLIKKKKIPRKNMIIEYQISTNLF